ISSVRRTPRTLMESRTFRASAGRAFAFSMSDAPESWTDESSVPVLIREFETSTRRLRFPSAGAGTSATVILPLRSRTCFTGASSFRHRFFETAGAQNPEVEARRNPALGLQQIVRVEDQPAAHE